MLYRAEDVAILEILVLQKGGNKSKGHLESNVLVFRVIYNIIRNTVFLGSILRKWLLPGCLNM